MPQLTPATRAGRWWMSPGDLIGINTAILSSSGGNLGIGFAIPSDLASQSDDRPGEIWVSWSEAISGSRLRT